jgi:energy-coupling factor transporter ATP-binding protein EcfA2
MGKNTRDVEKWTSLLSEIRQLLVANHTAARTLAEQRLDWNQAFSVGGGEELASALETSTVEEVLLAMNAAHQALMEGASRRTVEQVLARIVPMLYDRRRIDSLSGTDDGGVLRIPVATSSVAEIVMAGIDARALHYQPITGPKAMPEPLAEILLRDFFESPSRFRILVENLGHQFLDRGEVMRLLSGEQYEEQLAALVNDEIDWQASDGGGLRHYVLFDSHVVQEYGSFLGRLRESLPALRLVELTGGDVVGERRLCFPLRDVLYRAQQPTHAPSPRGVANRRIPELPPPTNGGPVPTNSAEIRSLRIRNLRIFDDFTLELGEIQPGKGQWSLLLGDNGVGKTTILRSLALALADRRAADSLFQLGGSSAPFLRSASSEGTVEVSFAGETRQVQIRRSDQEVELLDGAPGSEGAAWPVYAYGCQRGSALGGATREVTFKPLDEVRSLFDEAADLIHAETWLQKLRLAALESAGGAAASFFEAVLHTVAAVLHGVDEIDVNKDGVWLVGPKVGRAPLGALSDGHVTTAGWLLDLIARWAHRCERAGVELDADFRGDMTALVLIDEIDLHLHPLWQVEILGTLREQFPRLSVVASTHNPLTLLGARSGEVHVLRRENGRVVAHQRDLPPGVRTDQVLTGEWFGLASTVDRDTLGLLAEHRALLRQADDASPARREELERNLRLRLGTFADTSIDRIVASVAAELIGDDFEELTPEARQRIRQKILTRARAETSA